MISLVIPVFNERDSLPQLLREIHETAHANEIDFEVILVNDGSSDDSWEVIRELAAQDGHSRPCKAQEKSPDERISRSSRAVGAVDCRRMDPDEQRVFTWHWVVHVCHTHHLGRPIPGAERSLHSPIVAGTAMG